jgi:hypothetical protein
VNTRIILGVLYYVLITPFGVVMRFFRDPLRLKPEPVTAWIKRDPEPVDLERYRQQF